jgi:hypothetical protein
MEDPMPKERNFFLDQDTSLNLEKYSKTDKKVSIIIHRAAIFLALRKADNLTPDDFIE